MSPRLAAARAVGIEIAARHADDVDLRARFPAEALTGLKERKLLGILVPESEGGAAPGSPMWSRSATNSASTAPRRP